MTDYSNRLILFTRTRIMIACQWPSYVGRLVFSSSSSSCHDVYNAVRPVTVPVYLSIHYYYYCYYNVTTEQQINRLKVPHFSMIRLPDNGGSFSHLLPKQCSAQAKYTRLANFNECAYTQTSKCGVFRIKDVSLLSAPS